VQIAEALPIADACGVRIAIVAIGRLVARSPETEPRVKTLSHRLRATHERPGGGRGPVEVVEVESKLGKPPGFCSPTWPTAM
jgi:hypothetical protein